MTFTGNLSREEREARELKRKADIEQIALFVEHSERISGVGFTGDKKDWEREGVKRHRELAEILLLDAHKFVSPGLINSALTNRPCSWYRTGSDAAFKNLVPPGDQVPGLVENLDRWIGSNLSELAEAEESRKNAFAWQAHLLLLCTFPFKEKNSRTARLLLNHIRKLLRLPPHIIRYEKAEEYIFAVQQFRENNFRHDIDLITKELVAA